MFAPENRAFDALGPNILDYVLNPHNVKDLDTVLTYHVHAGKVLSNQITNGEKISTVDGVDVVAGVNNGVVTIDGARVIAADNLATNGVAHIIDRVLIPSNLVLPTSTVAELAIATSSLSTLVTAVTTANLVNFFNTTAPMTVFAPTNDPFNNLPAGTLDYLLAHPAELAQVLYYHAIDRRRYSEQFVNFERLRTFDGREIIAVVENGVVSLNAAANVTLPHIQGSNGGSCTSIEFETEKFILIFHFSTLCLSLIAGSIDYEDIQAIMFRKCNEIKS